MGCYFSGVIVRVRLLFIRNLVVSLLNWIMYFWIMTWVVRKFSMLFSFSCL